MRRWAKLWIPGGRRSRPSNVRRRVTGGPLYPIGRGNDHGVLCLNHEFGTNSHVLGKPDPESLEDVRLSQAAHGISVVGLRSRRGRWGVVRGRLNRRITVNTPVEVSGPVAGHPLLSDGVDPDRGPDPVRGRAPSTTVGSTPPGSTTTAPANGWS